MFEQNGGPYPMNSEKEDLDNGRQQWELKMLEIKNSVAFIFLSKQEEADRTRLKYLTDRNAKKKGENKYDLHVASSVQFSAAAEGTLQVDTNFSERVLFKHRRCYPQK